MNEPNSDIVINSKDYINSGIKSYDTMYKILIYTIITAISCILITTITSIIFYKGFNWYMFINVVFLFANIFLLIKTKSSDIKNKSINLSYVIYTKYGVVIDSRSLLALVKNGSKIHKFEIDMNNPKYSKSIVSIEDDEILVEFIER